MSIRKTLVWLMVAGALFAFIYFLERNLKSASKPPNKVFPELRADAVTSILIRPSGPVQLQIRVDRTNGAWQLTQPLSYAAQTEKVTNLLAFLQNLRPAPYLNVTELRHHSNADEEFGFAAPLATFVIQQGDYCPRVRLGALTNPGDQVYLQIEGDLGAYVVDSELLKLLPQSADDWRDTSLINFSTFAFDRIGVTNNAKGDPARPGLPASSSAFVLQRDPTNRLWRMVWPLDARANNTRVEDALSKLRKLKVRKFVSDDPKLDFEPLDLAPAQLELGFSNGTNNLELLQFGRCPSNNVSAIFAHRAAQSGAITVDKDLLLPWCSILNDFRDPHLLELTSAVESVEFVNGTNNSSAQRQTDGSWRLLPGDSVADSNLVPQFFSALTNLEILRFVNDVVNAADLPDYGLSPPLYRMRIKTAGTTTNASLVELDFGRGTNLQDAIYVKRTDESFVYAISTNDFARLPVASWQLRDRSLCHFDVSDVAGLTLVHGSRICRMIHKGPVSWTFAPGSQGIINDGAVEETVRGVLQTSAICWVDRGESALAGFGLGSDAARLIFDLKDGSKFELKLGGSAPSGNIYAAVALDGQPWIMEFPWALVRDLDSYFPLSAAR
ncbi:MAG TPA: DUF4340 domain-containing protein [Verrucomicrobiae bacterium]|jgi:hypothetical protein|nr:DUF4340 domain-containing protein [Verrucomicrobiae bacterium]